MILTHCSHDAVLHVCMHMRALDREEIYGLRWEENPFVLMNEVMAQRNFAWVAWHDGKPAVVVGGAPIHPHVWQMFAFGTDDFECIARPLTRFAKKAIVPGAFRAGAKRLQADSHEKHVTAHRWLERIGAHQESVRKGYGRDGADYLHFALARPPEVDKADIS